MKQFTLSRNERLKSRKQIDLLFSNGTHLNIFPLRVSYISGSEARGEPLQFGVGVSGRWFKKAVDRNRVKRLVRESWRVQKNGLREILQENQLNMMVFIVYTGRELPEYDLIRESTLRVIENLCRIANEAAQANT